MDTSTIMTAVVAFLAPYTPALIELGKEGAKEAVKTVAKKGTDSGWEKATQLWGKLKEKFDKDKEVQLTTELLALQPEDEDKQAQLATLLVQKTEDAPALTAALADILGGQDRVQKMTADNGVLAKVRQKMKGSGTQTMEARNGGTIIDAEQSIE